MEYAEVPIFLAGIARLGYLPYYAAYCVAFDLMFYTNGFQFVILQNLGAFRGMRVYHSSALQEVTDEIERIRIQDQRAN